MNHATPDLDHLICFNFYLGWRAIQAYYKEAFGNSMTAQRMYVLALCQRDEPITVSAIAHSLSIDLPAVSGLLDRMEKDGLVRRQRVPDNRRTVHVTLTAHGEQVRREHDQRLQAADMPLFDKYVSPRDMEALRRVVTGISTALEERDAGEVTREETRAAAAAVENATPEGRAGATG